jgi:uncharacterized protein (TIGR00297 family)
MAHQLLIGYICGLILAVIAWRLGALSPSGALAASVTGGLIFGLGGLSWAVLLLIFFTTSSFLSTRFKARKVIVEDSYSKGAARDWQQVMANGSLGVLMVILSSQYPSDFWIWVAYGGSIAAVTADTWGTELGVLDPRLPRLISSGVEVPRGTSGAVSLVGSLAAGIGAIFIGAATVLIAYLHQDAEFEVFPVLLSVSIGGICGALADSLLGSTVQVQYYCPQCRKTTERFPQHTCGVKTQYQRGWRWMTNDLVNLCASITGAFFAVSLWGISEFLM